MDPLQFSVCLACSPQIPIKMFRLPASLLHHMDFAPLDAMFFLNSVLYLFFLKISDQLTLNQYPNY